MTNVNPTPNGTNVVPKLSNQAYDVLKFVAQIFLPALGTLYFVVAGLWHLPAVVETIGTITAIDVFLGALLGLSSKTYNKAVVAGDIPTDGKFVINHDDPNKDNYSVEFDTPLNELDNKKVVTLTVRGPN